jgi:hypothetical protein
MGRLDNTLLDFHSGRIGAYRANGESRPGFVQPADTCSPSGARGPARLRFDGDRGWRSGAPQEVCFWRRQPRALETRMARAILNRLSHVDLSWIRIEIALLTGALILAG